MRTIQVTSTTREQLDWEPQILVASYNRLDDSCKDAIFSSLSLQEKETLGTALVSAESTAVLAYRGDVLAGWAIKSGGTVVASKVLASEKAALTTLIKSALKS